jgi:hypothetical protein
MNPPPPGPSHPRISIAVPSYNQGPFIGETLQSLVDQQYPNLEVLIQDGGSTDGAIAVAEDFVARFPAVFSLAVQRDRGHAHALNLAFARSTGEILGYLNTDDTLYPGCLHRVARELDPARGRYIVFGRCLFVGEGAPYVGREHPAEYRGHFDLLAVWRRGYNAIPQPSTFWHRRVYERCGDFDERYNHGLDYLQWCRFSKHFAFHKVDALWSTYRLHPVSVTASKTEGEWLEIMARYSRLHWGPWWTPLHWRCAVSSRLHDRALHEAARQSGVRAGEALRAGRYPRALLEAVRSAVRSPRLAAYVVARRLGALGLGPGPLRGRSGREREPTGQYGDGWIGPVYRNAVRVPPRATRLILRLEHHAQGHHRRVSPALWINGALVERRRAEAGRDLSFSVDVAPLRGTVCALEIRTPEFFVPRFATGADDDRRLSLLLLEERVE